MIKNKLSFYLQKNNKLFNGDVLVVGYDVTREEMNTYGFTSNSLIAFIKCDDLEKIKTTDNVDYIKVISESFRNKNVFIRMQSECLLGMYGDSHCDCEEQRRQMIDIISKEGGVYIHMPQEAQGLGLIYKLKELELQVSGRSQDGSYVGAKTRDEAQKLLLDTLKFNDCRNYSLIFDFLKSLKLEECKFVLLSNNKDKLNDLRKSGLKVQLFSENNDVEISYDNLSEYLVKILNEKHQYDEKTIDKILQQIIKRNYNERTLATLIAIVNRIKTEPKYKLSNKFKDKILETYNAIICGEERKYFIEGQKVIKKQNNFCCRVSNNIFKAIKNVYHKNLFDRVSFEKLYYFEKKDGSEMIKIRTSTILDVKDDDSLFFVGQKHAEQRKINREKTKVVQSEVTISKLKSYFENSEYNYVKRVEMITVISEFGMPGVKIFVKRIPTIENRVLDVFGKSENIRKFLNKITEYDSNILLDQVTNFNFEDENFNDYNLRFADLNSIVEEEKYMFKLLKRED